MTFSSLVAPQNVRSTSQQSPRGGAAIDHFILHHSAAFDVNQVINEMVSGSRQVSANYVVANDGTPYGIVPEELRAWTSGATGDGGKGAAWDKRSITFEVLDQTGAPDWLISLEASATVAMIIADVSKRHAIAPQRSGGDTTWTVYGHRELYTIFGASYATACPGGMDLNGITAAAQAILAGHTNGEEVDMMIQPLPSRVIRNLGNGTIAMLHPSGVAQIGDPMIPDLASASGAGLVAGQPLNDGSLDKNSKGYYWIDLASDRYGWEIARHQALLAAQDAHIKSIVGALALTDAQVAAIGAQLKGSVVDLSGLESAVAAVSKDLATLDTQADNYQSQVIATLAKGLTIVGTAVPAK